MADCPSSFRRFLMANCDLGNDSVYGEKLLPNLVAVLWILTLSPRDMVEGLIMRLCKSATAATIFGFIAVTPAYQSPVTSLGLRYSRTLRALFIGDGAGLLLDSISTPSWTTSVRLGLTGIDPNPLERCNAQALDTLFELLKLAGRQDNVDEWRLRDELSHVDPKEYPAYRKHPICLQATKEGYEAFAEKVGSGWFYSS
jgi:hypothetical protein